MLNSLESSLSSSVHLCTVPFVCAFLSLYRFQGSLRSSGDYLPQASLTNIPNPPPFVKHFFTVFLRKKEAFRQGISLLRPPGQHVGPPAESPSQYFVERSVGFFRNNISKIRKKQRKSGSSVRRSILPGFLYQRIQIRCQQPHICFPVRVQDNRFRNLLIKSNSKTICPASGFRNRNFHNHR